MTRGDEQPPESEAVRRLAHELSEPITAIVNYLVAAERLLRPGTQLDRTKLEAAIRDALAQVPRAADVLRRLRSLAQREAGGEDPR